MERFKHVKPTIEYKRQAIEYIQEFYECNSRINGASGLQKYLDNYEKWLDELEEKRNRVADEEEVPSEEFFLVRENDNKIVGLVNIRLALNEDLRKHGGNIGYSIRPTERRKGYNKVNLFLALLCCQKHGIDEVLLDCDKDNLASAKTMQALGGKLIKEFYEEEEAKCIVQQYIIPVDKAIKEHKDTYRSMIIIEDL